MPLDRYEARYEWAKLQAGVRGPSWLELTDEQRQAIRDEVHRYDRELGEFVELIKSKGLPDAPTPR